MDYIFQVEKDERSPADIAYVKSKIGVVKRMSYERGMQLESGCGTFVYKCFLPAAIEGWRKKKVVM